MNDTAAGIVICENCGDKHEAWYDHEGQYGEGAIYAVVCKADWMTDYVTSAAFVGV